MGGSPFGPPECAAHAVKHGMNATIRRGRGGRASGRPARGPESAVRAAPGPGATVPLDFEVPEHLSRPGWAEGPRRPECAYVPTFSDVGASELFGASRRSLQARHPAARRGVKVHFFISPRALVAHSCGAHAILRRASRSTHMALWRPCTAPPALGGAAPRGTHCSVCPDLGLRLCADLRAVAPHSCGAHAPLWGASRCAGWSQRRPRTPPPALGGEISRRPRCALQAHAWRVGSPRAPARRARTAAACT